ncbi:hypothetical protein NQZ68_021820 [Dissostichus eleginoides]|nr:hypothetical protein NQZ68_021820 [Dissostichus eleginoides]
MANYRTLLLYAHGTSAELAVNLLKTKSQEESYPAKNLKRAKRAEANHFPSLPSEQQKRNIRQTIKEKMAKTFGYRRQEIVHQRPSIEGLLERWPALFHMEEVNAEFMRITTFPLETKFLAQLDKHSTKLLQVIRSRGGVVKQKTTGILQVLDETVDITIRRECILKSLMIYLGEPVDHLIKEFQETEAGELEQATMAIFVTGKEDPFHPPKDVKILIEGTEVLNGLPSVATAFAMLFGLIRTEPKIS